MPFVGAHLSIAGGLHKCFETAEKLNCEAFQIFTRSQLKWVNNSINDLEKETWEKTKLHSRVKEIVSHASYLINLAGTDNIRQKSIIALRDEINRCHNLSIEKVVLHPGSYNANDLETSLKILTDSIKIVLNETSDTKVKILLETMAGQGHYLGRNLEEFEKIMDLISADSRVAFCVDTCHIFAAGYDIRTVKGYENFVLDFDKRLGIDRLQCWHLNDSKKTLASHVDRHEHLGMGEIGLEPFKCIMTDGRFEKIPALLETPKRYPGDERNLDILRDFRRYGGNI